MKKALRFNGSRFSAILFACFMAMLTACGDGESNEIIVATNAEFPPFEYIADGEGLKDGYSGADVAISLEIAKELGKELTISDMEFESVLAAVDTGKADFAASGLTASPERAETVDFSIPYCTAEQNILVKSDNQDIQSAQDIIDKRVGVIQGYTGEFICSDDLGIQDLTSYKSGMQAAQDLKQSRLDCVVIDSKTAEAILRLNDDLKIVTDSATFEAEQYAIAVKKGNGELLTKINGVLQRLIDEGAIDQYIVDYSLDE
jgi:polar amino acid transport system substrate-binding protein